MRIREREGDKELRGLQGNDILQQILRLSQGSTLVKSTESLRFRTKTRTAYERLGRVDS